MVKPRQALPMGRLREWKHISGLLFEAGGLWPLLSNVLGLELEPALE